MRGAGISAFGEPTEVLAANHATLPNQAVYRDLRRWISQDTDGSGTWTSISVELQEIGPQPRNLCLILQAREYHFVSRNFCSRILHERREA
jgi:hypothetical protein